VRNLTDTRFDTGVYRDDIDATRGGDPRYPLQNSGEGRSVQVGIELSL
jgi:hypothetical protein